MTPLGISLLVVGRCCYFPVRTMKLWLYSSVDIHVETNFILVLLLLSLFLLQMSQPSLNFVSVYEHEIPNSPTCMKRWPLCIPMILFHMKLWEPTCFEQSSGSLRLLALQLEYF
jgi:hypothetical protein